MTTMLISIFLSQRFEVYTIYDRYDDRFKANDDQYDDICLLILLLSLLVIDCVCYGSNSIGDRVHLSTEH